jgi:hypothetical protein
MFADGPPKSVNVPLKSGIEAIFSISAKTDFSEREAMNLP